MPNQATPVALIAAAALYFASTNVLFSHLLPAIDEDIDRKHTRFCQEESYAGAFFGALSMIASFVALFAIYLQMRSDILLLDFFNVSVDTLQVAFALTLLGSVVSPLFGILIVSGTLHISEAKNPSLVVLFGHRFLYLAWLAQNWIIEKVQIVGRIKNRE